MSLTNRQVAAAKKAYLAWGGCLYVCGKNDSPPKEYYAFCKIVQGRRERAMARETAKLLELSLELVNRNRGGG